MNWIPIVIIALFVGIIIYLVRFGRREAQKSKFYNDYLFLCGLIDCKRVGTEYDDEEDLARHVEYIKGKFFDIHKNPMVNESIVNRLERKFQTKYHKYV